jgi:PKD repeat protein
MTPKVSGYVLSLILVITLLAVLFPPAAGLAGGTLTLSSTGNGSGEPQGAPGDGVYIFAAGFAAGTNFYCWFDNNSNGIRDTGEPFKSAATGVTGEYSSNFSAPIVPAGAYNVLFDLNRDSTVEASAAWTITGKLAISPASGIPGSTITVSTSSNGFAAGSSGYIWFDNNSDGNRDAGEPQVTVTTSVKGAITVAAELSVPFVGSGTYHVLADIPAGGDIEASANFNIVAAISLSPSTGVMGGSIPISITGGGFSPATPGVIWFDTDNDSVLDALEPQVALNTTAEGSIPAGIVLHTPPLAAASVYRVRADIPVGGVIEAAALFVTSSTTGAVKVTRLADDGSTVLGQITVTYQEMMNSAYGLPIMGDGTTHYYHQGPVFINDPDEATEQGLRWNPAEDNNVLDKDFGALRGTNIKDLCNLVGGMAPGEELEIRSSDGWSRLFAYKNVYEYTTREGPMVLTWEKNGLCPDTGYGEGMRLVWFADAGVNPWGVHAFGNWDWYEVAESKYWYFYQSGDEYYPTTTGLSGQLISELIIYSGESPSIAPVAGFTADVQSGTAPLTVNFTDQSENSPASWAWDFDNDGTADSTIQDPSYIYSDPGIYSVKLTVANTAGSDEEVKTGYIAVNAPALELLWGPYLTGITADGTVISIKTSIATSAVVEYATEDYFNTYGDYDQIASDEIAAEMHHIILTGLDSDTVYHYRVKYDEENTADCHFRTFPLSGPFTFVVYGDTQDELPQFSQAERHKLVADRIASQDDVLFVINTGDLVNDGSDTANWDRYFDAAREMMTGIPVFAAPGNHEENSELYYEAFGLPAYYSFDCSSAHFTILDTTGDTATQAIWLDTDLASPADWKFTFFHHPMYTSWDGHFGGWENLKSAWEELFIAHGVDAAWSGHVHAYERYLESGIMYSVVGIGGGPLGTLNAIKYTGYRNSLEHSLGYARVTVDPGAGTTTVQMVRVADVSPDNLTVTTVYPPGTVFEMYSLPPTCTITASAGPNGCITPSGQVSVSYGDNVSFSIIPDTGYHVADVLVDGIPAGPVPGWKFTNVTADHTISALFTFTLPVADFSSDVQSGTAPLTVHFTDLSSGSPTSWAWDFDNNGTVD